MTSQIFKKKIPNELLFKLLDDTCDKNEKYFILNNISFKKGLYNESISIFLDLCKPFYYNYAKKKYLDKKITYNMFITVIRQICKFNNINYFKKIKYDKCEYDIIYFIYF
jgi:hypothetical protein